MIPLQKQWKDHMASTAGEGKDAHKVVPDAFAFTERLIATNPRYFQAFPMLKNRFDNLKNKSYLAHEFFNSDWTPLAFSNMSDQMDDAKLSFAASADFIELVPAVNVTKEQGVFLDETSDPKLRQSLYDIMVNQTFRKDLWIKGTIQAQSHEIKSGILDLRVMLLTPIQDVELKAKGHLGTVDLADKIYTPVLSAMNSHEIMTVEQLHLATRPLGIAVNSLFEVVTLLGSKGDVTFVQSDEVFAKAYPQTRTHNRNIMYKSKGGNSIHTLASPVSGGGHTVKRFEQLFLLAMEDGFSTAIELSTCTWRILDYSGQRLLKDGKALETVDENLDELYPVHFKTRKSFGDMIRKLSDTSSHKTSQLLGTSSFKNPSMAVQKSLNVA
jgi:hypothetical protein